jgi:hypothetical protein
VGVKEQSGRTWPSIFWARGTPSKSGFKLVCNVNIVHRNLKSENFQDYGQKPQLILDPSMTWEVKLLENGNIQSIA